MDRFEKQIDICDKSLLLERDDWSERFWTRNFKTYSAAKYINSNYLTWTAPNGRFD